MKYTHFAIEENSFYDSFILFSFPQNISLLIKNLSPYTETCPTHENNKSEYFEWIHAK